MCFLCQSLDPTIEIYDSHGLTGPTAAPSGGDGSTTSAALPVFTLDQVAYQLTHGYWQDGGGDWRAFDVQAGGEITVNIDALDAPGQAAALAALLAITTGMPTGPDIKATPVNSPATLSRRSPT